MMEIQSPQQQPQSTTKIIDGTYVIDLSQQMGGGSYSKVYQAWVKSNQQQRLACKIISKVQLQMQIEKKTNDKNSRDKLRKYIIKRIEAEVIIGKKIKHPNIVQFIYCSQTERNFYIFMQRCEKYEEFNLAAQITQYAAKVPYNIVTAACLLYDNNITHRDIKAQNILIKNDVAKLADFGFAKFLRQKDNQEDGTAIGTMIYMAPQLIFQQKPIYSIKCDVWSIGVVIYYILYGSVPWQVSKDIQTFHLSLKKPIQFPSMVQVSAGLKNLISKMLLFREQDRIGIKEVKNNLDQILLKKNIKKNK